MATVATPSVVLEKHDGNPRSFSGDNEYLHRLADVRGDQGMLPRHAKPGDYTDDQIQAACDRWMSKSSFEWRNELVQRYAWAVPCDEALEAIARYSPIVEIGAGTGYWAHLLREYGVEVVAYDKSDTYYEGTGGMPLGTRWTAVVLGDARIVLRHPDHALFLCWPPPDDPMATDALMTYAGRYVIYVGDGADGCTADDAFYRILASKWKRIETVPLPTWFDLNDRLEVYSRKPTKSDKCCLSVVW